MMWLQPNVPFGEHITHVPAIKPCLKTKFYRRDRTCSKVVHEELGISTKGHQMLKIVESALEDIFVAAKGGDEIQPEDQLDLIANIAHTTLQKLRSYLEAAAPDGIYAISAEAYTDGRAVEITFDAKEWFEQATDDEISDLIACGYGGDQPADAVAQYFTGKLRSVDLLFEFINHDIGLGFECHIDKDDAENWIAANRSQLMPDETEDALLKAEVAVIVPLATIVGTILPYIEPKMLKSLKNHGRKIIVTTDWTYNGDILAGTYYVEDGKLMPLYDHPECKIVAVYGFKHTGHYEIRRTVAVSLPSKNIDYVFLDKSAVVTINDENAPCLAVFPKHVSSDNIKSMTTILNKDGKDCVYRSEDYEFTPDEYALLEVNDDE